MALDCTAPAWNGCTRTRDDFNARPDDLKHRSTLGIRGELEVIESGERIVSEEQKPTNDSQLDAVSNPAESAEPSSTSDNTLPANDEKWDRRELLAMAGAALVAGVAGYRGGLSESAKTVALKTSASKKVDPSALTRTSQVAVIKADSYSKDLADAMMRGILECGLDVTGMNVLLKPNFVEFDPNTCINTDVAVVAAALDVFNSLGAASVRIGEGPGHRRDTYAMAELTRYRSEITKFDSVFTDLNRDNVSDAGKFADRKEFYFSNTVLAADLIVSLAKMKTHHWAGATLSMKNYFGLVPGSVYGWPKNELHHIGISKSITELTRLFGPKSFAIVDGIVGMEGNGPIQGTPKKTGVLVMGSDLPAVDATCCRIMGIDPGKVEYLQLASDVYGVTDDSRIEQVGESWQSVRTNFQLIKEFSHLRLA
jgi:uncharacterized protein (DUF362 family)